MAVLSPISGTKRPAADAVGTPLAWRLVRAGERPAVEVAFEESVVEFFLEVAEVLAVPKSVAAIYGICFASPAPLSYSEVRERLDISAGSISQGLRVLRDVGALKIVTTPLDHREYFTPDLEMRKLIAHYLEERLQKQLKSGGGRLERIVKSVPSANESSAKILKGRLKSLQDWHRKARALLPIARTFLKLGT